MRRAFYQNGWLGFGHDPQISAWLDQVRETALGARHDAAMIRAWLRCQGTWFVGVNALQNDGAGRVAGAGPLEGRVMRFIRRDLGFRDRPLDRAQVSICYPGYPKPNPGESDAAAQFRRRRDAAHIDGLHPVGPKRRRKLLEFQGFILGLPLTHASMGAAPLVVWQGSHHIIGRALRHALRDVTPEKWPEVDLTKIYHSARKEVFATCPRVELHALPGEAHVLHRMALHGVAPWKQNASADPAGRAILYFRPEIEPQTWLAADPDAITDETDVES